MSETEPSFAQREAEKAARLATMPEPDFMRAGFNSADPSQWLTIYLDQSVPLADGVRKAWVRDCARASRQWLMPFVRPVAKLSIGAIQILKLMTPRSWRAAGLLHRFLAFAIRTFVTPEGSWFILRHFHLGSQILAFVAANSPVPISTNPLLPANIDALKDNTFVQHDINLFNLVIRLNTALREQNLRLKPVEQPDYSMIREPDLALADQPAGWLNVIDLPTAIEICTPVFQLLLTDSEFFRASHSLQLDETIAIYCATILGTGEHLFLLNNKHPLVPVNVVDAGENLVLHGLNTEMLHRLLVLRRDAQALKQNSSH